MHLTKHTLSDFLIDENVKIDSSLIGIGRLIGIQMGPR